MKAILVNDDRSLRWDNVPDPKIKSEEVLVEIHAAALNRADLMQHKFSPRYHPNSDTAPHSKRFGVNANHLQFLANAPEPNFVYRRDTDAYSQGIPSLKSKALQTTLGKPHSLNTLT